MLPRVSEHKEVWLVALLSIFYDMHNKATSSLSLNPTLTVSLEDIGELGITPLVAQ